MILKVNNKYILKLLDKMKALSYTVFNKEKLLY